MNAPHWHDTTSAPGPVDPHGCCADQPTATSTIVSRGEYDRIRAEIAAPATPVPKLLAALRKTAEADAAVRLADALTTPTYPKDTP